MTCLDTGWGPSSLAKLVYDYNNKLVYDTHMGLSENTVGYIPNDIAI